MTAPDVEVAEHVRPPVAALTCGVLGFGAAVLVYWMVVPGLVLGVAAIVLGVRACGRDAQELGNVAITLGIVAILLVPTTLWIADEAEQWGRDCTENPAMDPNC